MLGTVDFSEVQELKAVDAGVYDGQTNKWEAVQNNDGKGMHIKAFFLFEHEDRNVPIFTRWPLKKEGLWRTKRDLVALGADPAALSEKNVDLEQILAGIFGVVPTPVRLSVKKVIAKNPDGTPKEPDPITGEQEYWNELDSVRRIG